MLSFKSALVKALEAQVEKLEALVKERDARIVELTDRLLAKESVPITEKAQQDLDQGNLRKLIDQGTIFDEVPMGDEDTNQVSEFAQ